MFTFRATAAGESTAFDKTVTMTPEAATAMIGSMRKRFSINGTGQVATRDAVTKQPIVGADGVPVTHLMTNEEAIELALGSFLLGWGQNARVDAEEAAVAAAKAAVSAAPDWTVVA